MFLVIGLAGFHSGLGFSDFGLSSCRELKVAWFRVIALFVESLFRVGFRDGGISGDEAKRHPKPGPK